MVRSLEYIQFRFEGQLVVEILCLVTLIQTVFFAKVVQAHQITHSEYCG